ncbi:MAG: DUF6765 family protein [Thermodesulfobacteriota bacterium]|nr:DUF6765 family protein [Thermodesulfobacteriota bacterium]
MNTEFHYYITGIIAHAAGFSPKEAKTIATASEFVDENDVTFTIEDRSSGEPYEVYISQTMNILKPKRKLMRIYPVFHFLPGDPGSESAYRRDGKMHLLNTTPNNELANNLMDEAFKSTEDMRLYRIGVATHAYADTWAHQNFVGWYDYFNNIGLDPKPDIGHADAEHHPDWVAHRWQDERLVNGDIDNTERFLEAGENLYKKYQHYTETRKQEINISWSELREWFLDIFGKSNSGPVNWYEEDRIETYRKEYSWLGEFDEDDWFEDAIETKVRGLKDSKKGLASTFIIMRDKYFWREDVDKEKTDWFRFQESVKAHQALAMEYLKTTFDKMGIDLHRY